MTGYFTDGTGLYEVVRARVQRSSGLGGPTVGDVWLLNVHTHEQRHVTLAQFAEFREVERDIEHEVADLRDQLARWADKAPAWLE